jgi:hypothetical protein
VTFTLPGFKTVKRDGIELTGTFVATVSADLAVGTLDETITVTGQSPVVRRPEREGAADDERDVIAAIPSSRNAAGLQSLIPGLNVSQAGLPSAAGTPAASRWHGWPRRHHPRREHLWLADQDRRPEHGLSPVRPRPAGSS